MASKISQECQTLIERLKQCNLEEILEEPERMIKFYPIRDPDNEATIFDEVYSLLSESFMKKSYKFRFFFFLNTFLSTTKVPGHVIAAYIKKLSRLTLNAKPRSLVIILRLIGNLFLRHPVLLILRDRVGDKALEFENDSDECTLRQWMECDPFEPEEYQDLKATRAMDSCIWELMPLRFHRLKKVAEAAQYLGQSTLPDIEFDLTDLIR